MIIMLVVTMTITMVVVVAATAAMSTTTTTTTTTMLTAISIRLAHYKQSVIQQLPHRSQLSAAIHTGLRNSSAICLYFLLVAAACNLLYSLSIPPPLPLPLSPLPPSGRNMWPYKRRSVAQKPLAFLSYETICTPYLDDGRQHH